MYNLRLAALVGPYTLQTGTALMVALPSIPQNRRELNACSLPNETPNSY